MSSRITRPAAVPVRIAADIYGTSILQIGQEHSHSAKVQTVYSTTKSDESRLRLQDHVVIVTGAGGGIGSAIAARLVLEGAKVAILDRDATAGAAAANRLAGTAGAAAFFHCDVTRREEVRRSVAGVIDRWGKVTGLVNNAGIGRRAPFLELPDDAWDAVIGVNLTGAFIVAQEACRAMVKGGGGAVVNMASIAGHMAHSDQSVYSVSKAGLEALTRAMAFELAPLGLRANAVSPGTILTEFLDGMLTEEARSARVQRIPSGRLGKPEEVAATVAFLLSNDASYVTGSTVTIDGGLLFAGIRTDNGRAGTA